MTDLIRYDAACRALAECKAIDEVKAWANKAAAMQAYGRMAQDKTLEVDAAEIRIRAERRLGEMIAAQKAEGGLSPGGRPSPETPRQTRGVSSPTLSDAGISYDLSSRAQKLAAVPAAEFEAEVGEWRGRVTAENARVSARLQQAGERHQATAPQNDADYGPSAEEVAEAEQSAKDDAERVRILLESDSALAEMTAKYEQAQHRIRQLESRIAGLTTEKNEAVRLVKAWRRKAEKAA